MLSWIGGLWAGGTLLALATTRAAGRADAHAEAVLRALLAQDGPTKPCVLVVDDDPEIRRVLQEAIQCMGYQTVEASGGREAVVQARLIHPQAVLMDLMMPEVDGYTAARQLKSDPALADIPIAAFSGYLSPESQREATEAGMGIFLAKPAPPEQLERMLQSLIKAA